MNKLEMLRNVPTFACLTEEQLALLAVSVGSQSFERGETIFHQGSIGSALYIVASGQVRITILSGAGHEHTVAVFHAGDFFGEMALLDGQPRSASATAMQPTRTLTLHRAAFLHTINARPQIAAALLEAMAQRLRQTNSYAEQLASNSAAQRVVRKILDMAARQGADPGAARIDLRLTQDDLASMSGTTRETVNRVLSSLRDQGLIRVARARVSVLNLAQLERSLEL